MSTPPSVPPSPAPADAAAPVTNDSPVSSPKAVGLQVGRGFCMGAADVVPGVSGGTVALVFGIYERLVANVRQGARALGRAGRLDLKGTLARLGEVDWWFLVPLLVGIGLAIATLAHAIEVALEEHPVPMAALFLGLVAASAVVASRMVEAWGTRRVAVLAVSTVVTALVLGLQSGERLDAPLWAFGLAGALAICAMILPGVSGSFLLLAVGMYELVLDAVTDRDLLVLGVFTLGCVIGLGLFSSALSWALEHHRDTVLAALVGLMIGSLRVLWPWPSGIDNVEVGAPAEQWGLALAIGTVAFLAVIVLSEVAERRLERKRQQLPDPR